MDYSIPNQSLYNIPFRHDEFNGMPFRSLGASGLRVPNVGLGTWKIGYPETGDGSRVDEQTAFQIFDRAVELGVTFWDTANRYNAASGNSERVIGNWFNANPGQRRNVVIATKMFGAMDGVTPNHSGLSRGNIIDSVYASLGRMRIDYIDVLYFHGFDGNTPIEESLAAVEDLVRQNLIRYFAVSNFSVEQLAAYQKVEQAMSVRCRVLAVQNQYDILAGERLQGVLDHAKGTGVSFIPWSPMARGLLTSRYLDPAKIGSGDRLHDEGDAAQPEAVMSILRQLAELAQDWDMELSQLVIAYMLTIPGMGTIIPSSSNLKQLESNAAAGRIVLSGEQQLRTADVLKELRNLK
ncbi:aldo/keto reductase [Paenibacillus eucommiae]|uniref:Aryl-alcohol dehydrogenase-like predicted oxidoreductase n=1 Tax=Paenibacillus eucommiae TaxID=1355755 RepID=A0ABS4IW23_9BACL|nr:aldo/keto reductase [Paenibacillus eucommiae]MBP1991792.1 aryl-alcohol dehydrogenase-like predicted oxidoreductase [Paenibacillus eucommiae]